MRTHRFTVALGSIVATAILSPSILSARDLSFEDRVAAQKAIEQVYWNHRIWPKENPQPKPEMSTVLGDDAIRATVEDYIEKSNALETWWHRPITGAQLQDEMTRMAANSRDPRVLQEVFAALGNDSFLIAETLARETLVDRLIRGWYASDSRFHADVRARAMAARESCASVDCMKSLGGEYRQETLTLQSEDADREDARADAELGRLDPDQWNEQLDTLASRFSTDVESIPSRQLSRLEELADSFVVSAVLSRQSKAVTIASVSWPKRSFDAWWSGQRQPGSKLAGVTESFVFPTVTASGCTIDSWTPTAQGVPVHRSSHSAVWTGAEMIVWGGQTAEGVYVVTGGRYNPSTDSWKPTSTVNAPTTARSGNSAVWTGTVMIIWGGLNSSTYVLNDGASYNPTTDTWTQDQTANPLVGRGNHTAVWTGTEMIVWGGTGHNVLGYHTLNSGGRYNPQGDYDTAWTAISTGANVPAARTLHSAVWTGTRMIVWGGSSDTSSNLLNTGGLYDPATDSWTATSTTNAPTARNGNSAVWTGTRMLIWGGAKSGLATNTGGLYDPATASWSATATGANVPAARSGHGTVWTGTTMIVWGGYTGSAYVSTGGRYNPATASWTSTSVGTNVPAPGSGFSTVWTGSEMIVWGGADPGGSRVNTGGRYDPSTDSWVPTSTSPDVPEARGGHTAIWTGAEMIVWGGEGTTPLNTGSRYNPSTDAWKAISTGANVPSGRYSHSAVWTGREMVVWGGYDGSTYFGTGARYNPSADSWIATATGPAARKGHSAVWTGTEMIVWGGGTFPNGLMNTGGRYNPSTDSWIATSTVQAPSNRNEHTAVWTGKEMIVWSGFGCTGNPWCVLYDGSGYDPTTDAWTALPDGPQARTSHSAVWTGTDMIVWGGVYTPYQSPSHYLNDGARYNPMTGIWTTTSTGANVPTGRGGHSAVWTGARMIVWGGDTTSSQTGNTSTGGSYDPLTDIWTATSTVNAPSARNSHTATWTGSEMIVWGGSPATSAGGRYCACPNARTVYRDADGDGYGDPATSMLTECDGTVPAGYVENGSDCNDANTSVFPNAPEINNGADEQCSGDDGFGAIDEISGASGFMTAGDKTRFSWAPQSGATSYDVARSTTPDFSSGCALFSSNDTFVIDIESPASGTVFYYLVRSSAPNVGSWGQASGGLSRTGACLTP